MTTEPRASLVEVDLLPCPFCGGRPVARYTGEWGRFDTAVVECEACDVCRDAPSGIEGREAAIAGAIAAWNTRHRLEALRTQGDGEGWRSCRVGSCHRHQQCQYGPCRASPTQASSREEG